MKSWLNIVFVLFTLNVSAQTDTTEKSINDFQKSLVQEYSDKETSPLNTEAKRNFKGIHFYEVNKELITLAQFTRTPNEKSFYMNTSSGKRKEYVKYGIATFEVNHEKHSLSIYQSLDLIKSAEYKDYLFIPFTDDTNGTETYEGGRYLDLTTPNGTTILLDFNKAYQPYCAYTTGYNCPIPPQENYIPVKITAGVKF